jgi:hypothetical protein
MEEERAPIAAPVPIEGAMRTGQGDDDADEEMTIGEKFNAEPETLAEAAAALGADEGEVGKGEANEGDEEAAATAPAAQI